MISNKLVTALIITTGLATATASAGGRGVGNGGDVIVCPNSIEMLDSYEARIQRGISVDFGVGYPTVRSAVDVLLARIAKKDLVFRDQIAADAITLAIDLDQYLQTGKDVGVMTKVFPDEAALTDIDDSEELVVPIGCQKVQFGIQTTPKFREDKTFYVRGDLARKMSKEQLALFVMHEAIFKFALANEAQNSIETRYLNSLIASKGFDLSSMYSYLEATNKLSLYGQKLIRLGDAYYERDRVIANSELNAVSVLMHSNRYYFRGPLIRNGQSYPVMQIGKGDRLMLFLIYSDGNDSLSVSPVSVYAKLTHFGSVDDLMSYYHFWKRKKFKANSFAPESVKDDARFGNYAVTEGFHFDSDKKLMETKENGKFALKLEGQYVVYNNHVSLDYFPDKIKKLYTVPATVSYEFMLKKENIALSNLPTYSLEHHQTVWEK